MNRILMIVATFLALAMPAAQAMEGVRSAGLAVPLTATSRLVIPAAGNVMGAHGTHFRSDITLINFRNAEQQVQLLWVPQQGMGSPQTSLVRIPANSGLRFEDFTGTVLNQSGSLGAIIATGVGDSGLADPNALLHATVRIWTPQPGTAGTTSQSMITFPASSVNTPGISSIFGLRRDSRYRVNIGIVNLDSTLSQTFEVQESPLEVVRQVTLAPLSMQQVALTGTADLPQVIVRNVSSGPRSVLWYAYGSSVDNVTGDAWTELGIAGSAP